MSPNPPAHIYLVCSPQARVGTTTAARLLSDYQLWQRRALSVYDTDAHGRMLSSLFPECGVAADLSRTQGQMRLFDGLLSDGASVRVVDLCAPVYGQFFRQARQIAWFEEVRRLGIGIDVLFVTDLAPAALEAACAIAKTWSHIDPIVVTNDGAGALAQPLGEAFPGLPGERTFEIRALAAIGGRRPQLPSAPFAGAFLAGPGSDQIGALRGWLGRVFVQFRCHELRTALARLR